MEVTKRMKQTAKQAFVLQLVLLWVIWALMWPAFQMTGGSPVSTNTWYTDITLLAVLIVGSWRISLKLAFRLMSTIIYFTTSKEELEQEYGIEKP